MHPINKALTYVENHLNEDICMDDLAEASAISPFHLSRIFSYATGYSLGRYLRLRRLTEAARLLLQTEKSILDTALDVGYESHAVFSRAFKSEFGVTPRELRSIGSAHSIRYLQPIIWSPLMNITIPTPHKKQNLSLKIIGVSHSFKGDENATEVVLQSILPEFLPRLSEINHAIPPGYMQVIRNPESEQIYDYFVVCIILCHTLL